MGSNPITWTVSEGKVARAPALWTRAFSGFKTRRSPQSLDQCNQIWLYRVDYRMPQCRQCHVEFPNHVYVEGSRRNLQRRKFCLICSPFGMHNTNSEVPQPPRGGKRPTERVSPRIDGVNDECRVCGVSLKKRRGGRCNSCNTLIRRYTCKLRAIAYLGGQCKDCGLSGPPAVFQFHHKDPLTKDFTIGGVSNRKWDYVVLELDKCELLCANCHQIKHAVRKYHPRVVKEALRRHIRPDS